MEHTPRCTILFIYKSIIYYILNAIFYDKTDPRGKCLSLDIYTLLLLLQIIITKITMFMKIHFIQNHHIYIIII